MLRRGWRGGPDGRARRRTLPRQDPRLGASSRSTRRPRRCSRSGSGTGPSRRVGWAPNAIEGLPAELRARRAAGRGRRRDPRGPLPGDRGGSRGGAASGSPSKSCSSTRRCWRPASARHRAARPAPRLGKPGRAGRPLDRLAALRADRGPAARAFDEIDADLDSGEPMQRLLMGEVGSGKTVVAVYAMLRALEAGYQAALMAPTETLAEQHAITLGRLLAAEAIPFALLTGATPAAEPPASPEPARQRRAGADPGHPRADRADGPVRPPRPLRGRRAAPLRGRAAPRARRQGGGGDGAARPPHDRDADPAHALADRLRRPRHDRAARAAGRAASRSRRGWSARSERAGAYEFLRERLREGRQAFVVCPLVEESEKMPGQGGRGRGRAAARPASCATSRSASSTARCPRPRRPRRWRPSPRARPTCWWRRP